MLQVSSLRDYIEFSLGGAPSTKIGVMRIINLAGKLMFALADWNWKRREPAEIAFTAGQEYVNLPAAFGEVVAFSVNNDVLHTFEFVSHGRLIELRSNIFADLAGKYFGCVVYPAVASPAVIPSVPRLEIAPTPGSDIAEAMKIVYDARWVDVDSPDDYVQIPAFVEPLMFEVVDAVALGMHYSREGTMSARLSLVKQGEVFRSVRRTDLNLQPTLGPMEGGQIGEEGRWLSIARPESIGDPS